MKESNNWFDVLIPVARKDANFVRHTIRYVNENIVGCNKIYIVTNKANFPKLAYTAGIDKVVLLDENALVPELSFSKVRQFIVSHGEEVGCTGWYFQQLLKFAFATTDYAKEYYLTWDADTLPLNKIEFFKDGKPLLTKKSEYHKPYFETTQRLLGLGKLADFSFVAEHMLFKVDIVREMIKNIAANDSLNGDSWAEKILVACELGRGEGCCFSEFETYGTYCWKYYPNLYATRRLNTFRGAGMIRGRRINDKIIGRLAFDLDTASFEFYDQNYLTFPNNVPWFYCRIRNKIMRMCRDWTASMT